MSLAPDERLTLGAPAADPPLAAAVKAQGRSPARLAWSRLRRDRVAMASGVALLFFFAVALTAPLIEAAYGVSPYQQFQEKLNRHGLPVGHLGGVSGEHWFGLEPKLGRDLFIRMAYGIRTSIFIAFVTALTTTVLGTVAGIVAGYLGGWVDTVIGWLIDFALALPFLIFALAVVPTLTLRFYGAREEVPPWFRVGVLIAVLVAFGWTSTARLVRGQVLSLREREFVEAAHACNAGFRHMLFRQLLPNLWAPILVAFSLAVPAYVTGEAALSFLDVGVVEPTPSFGRTIFESLPYLETDPAYVLIPGLAIFALVLAFNLFGDALRDALDPRSSK